jgi:hypothetical protein
MWLPAPPQIRLPFLAFVRVASAFGPLLAPTASFDGGFDASATVVGNVGGLRVNRCSISLVQSPYDPNWPITASHLSFVYIDVRKNPSRNA